MTRTILNKSGLRVSVKYKQQQSAAPLFFLSNGVCFACFTWKYKRMLTSRLLTFLKNQIIIFLQFLYVKREKKMKFDSIFLAEWIHSGDSKNRTK